MTIVVSKPAIDLGIVTNNLEAMLKFYRDTIGLEFEAAIPMPGGGVMNRFKVGDSVIKIIETDPKPATAAAPGGIRGATGYRYWTITVSNMDACLARITEMGSTIVVPAKVIRKGVRISIVTDPDGNWVELLENS